MRVWLMSVDGRDGNSVIRFDMVNITLLNLAIEFVDFLSNVSPPPPDSPFSILEPNRHRASNVPTDIYD